LFVDIGNIWNYRNTAIGGGYDSLQFRLDPKKIYQQLGVSAGTGFQVDFTYFLIRFDLGFRFKKPYLSQNNGWQIPKITLKNIFGKGENIPDPNNPGATYNDERYRKWRYDNFNFTIGLSYPF
jgi:outer membrane protein assembly factor BamA